MQTPADLTTRLMTLASQRFDRPLAELHADDDFFHALGIDSLQALDLLTRVEEEFDVEVPDYELQGVNTFAGLADVIARRL
ncbi:MAG: acyl carrier protein [Deltaproteobacteria bacterium]|nr:MAG: acyl carrier protein [Deltaproteobacteria bacterium]